METITKFVEQLFKSQRTGPMLKKLDEMYDRQQKIESEITQLTQEYEQLKEDIEMLEMMIMHQSNKESKKKII